MYVLQLEVGALLAIGGMCCKIYRGYMFDRWQYGVCIVCPCKPVVGTCIRTRIHDPLVSQQPG